MENKQITLFKVLLKQLEELDKTRKINPKLIEEGWNLVKSFKTQSKKEKQKILHTIAENFWAFKFLIATDKFYSELTKDESNNKCESIKFDTFDSWSSLNFFCLGIDLGINEIYPLSPEKNQSNFKKLSKKLQELNAHFERTKNLYVSDPQEQKLFREVWKINAEQLNKNIKFSAYFTFKQVNDKQHFVNPELIKPTKFTSTDLYNRYKQYRLKQQQSNNY